MSHHVKTTRRRVGNFLYGLYQWAAIGCMISMVLLAGGCAVESPRPVAVVDERMIQVLGIVQQAGGGPVAGAEQMVRPWKALLHRLVKSNDDLDALIKAADPLILIADDGQAWSFANAAGVVLSRGMMQGRNDEAGRAAILALALSRWQHGSGTTPLQFASYLVGPPTTLNLLVGPLEPTREIAVRHKASRWLTAAGLVESGLAYAESLAGRELTDHDPLHIYRELDRARHALAAGQANQALNVLASLEQDHPAAQALAAEIELARGHHTKARAGFEQALASGIGHFRWWLGLGRAQLASGEVSEVRESLTRSAEILPTADAYYHLAMTFPEDSLRRDELLSQAAVSPSPMGIRAQKQLIASKILLEPGRFLAIRPRFDAMGQVYLEVENKTRVGMRDLEFSVADPHDLSRLEVYRLDAVAGEELAILIMDPAFAPALDRLQVRLKSALMAEN